MASFTSPTLGNHGITLDVENSDVVAPASTVTDPASLTAPATLNAVFAVAEVQALRNDVAALRTKLVSLLTELRNAGLLDS